jgi:hypothetical protein
VRSSCGSNPPLVKKVGCVTLYCSQIGKRISLRGAYLVPRRQPIISCLHYITSAVVVVVWYPFWKFVSPSRRFVCDSHTNSRAILNISATNQQQTNVFINNRPTLSSRALQGDSNAAKIIANGLVVTTTFRLL